MRSSDASSSTKSIQMLGDGLTTDRDTDKDDAAHMEASTPVENNRLLKDTAKKAEQATEQLLASVISLRSTHIKDFVKEKTNWPLTITSINEDRLLEQVLRNRSIPRKSHDRWQLQCNTATAHTRIVLTVIWPSCAQVGLSVEERNHIEGLSLVNRLSAAHNHTAINLARDPPREVFELQRRTRSWLLRP